MVALLGRWAGIPPTYAGDIRSEQDIQAIEVLDGGRIDITVGSVLNIFSGTGLKYDYLARRYGGDESLKMKDES